jgi:hypothetical protein
VTGGTGDGPGAIAVMEHRSSQLGQARQEPLRPVIAGIRREDRMDDPVREGIEQLGLASDVPVERGRLHAETASERAEAERVETLLVEEAQGLVDDLLPIQRQRSSLRNLAYGVRQSLTL